MGKNSESACLLAPAHTAAPVMRIRSRLLMSAMSGSSSRRPPLKGVVFDMDGTLTIPNLDFGLMYDRCGVARDEDILEVVERMAPSDAARARDLARGGAGRAALRAGARHGRTAGGVLGG